MNYKQTQRCSVWQVKRVLIKHWEMVHLTLFYSHHLRPLKTAACTVFALFLSLSTPRICDALRVFWQTPPPFHLISRLFHVYLILTWLWTSSTTHLTCSSRVGVKPWRHIVLPDTRQWLLHSKSTSPAADWFPVPCSHCILYTEARTLFQGEGQGLKSINKEFQLSDCRETSTVGGQLPTNSCHVEK